MKYLLVGSVWSVTVRASLRDMPATLLRASRQVQSVSLETFAHSPRCHPLGL